MLSQEEVEMWLSALRSSTIKQCHFEFSVESPGDSGKKAYCVWGVLGLVLGKDPMEYYKKFGELGRQLAGLNDYGRNFQELAQWIEEHEKCFV